MTETLDNSTPESSLELLFPTNLISISIKNDLPSNLTIRPLSLTDHSRNHTLLLTNLTHSPPVSASEWENQFKLMLNCSSTYYQIVIVNNSTDSLIACGTLLLERKFIRGLGLVGHIEDICVDKTMQGLGLGKILIKCLIEISESLGAYKCILDCSPENEAFYVKCGFENKGVEMAKYHK